MKITRILMAACCLLLTFSCGSSEKVAEAVQKATNTSLSPRVIVLTIDGGGIKGIIPAYILTQIEEILKTSKGKQLFEAVDVIGGTSTGGIITLGLTAPYNGTGKPRTAQEVLDIYTKDCSKIFVKNTDWTGPKYFAEQGIEPYLKSVFGTETLTSAQAKLKGARVKQVFTTTYVVNSTGGKVPDPKLGVDYGPYLFNWKDALEPGAGLSHDYYLWEAARATSAAPTYFPMANVGGGQNGRSTASEKWAVDGGVMSNDPAMWGVSEALRTGIASNLSEIVVISIGCGLDKYNGGLGVTNELKNDNKGQQEWGFWSWEDWGVNKVYNLNEEDLGGTAIVEVALDANQFVPNMQLQQLSGTPSGLTYIRVQPTDLPSGLTKMDNCSNTSSLLTYAQQKYGPAGTDRSTINRIASIISNF